MLSVLGKRWQIPTAQCSLRLPFLLKLRTACDGSPDMTGGRRDSALLIHLLCPPNALTNAGFMMLLVLGEGSLLQRCRVQIPLENDDMRRSNALFAG